jgi:DNA polymerase-3 subunit alpha
MGMNAHVDYVSRRHGSQTSTFPIPEYDYIFKDTYGLLVFQEQLMILAKDMCGFTDVEADDLRKAVDIKCYSSLEY